MVTPTKANVDWLISQACMCCVCKSLGTTLHQETCTFMKAPSLRKCKVSQHTNNNNEPYRVALSPVSSLTHSPTPPLKDQPQSVRTIVTGCNQALVSSIGTEEEYLVLTYSKSSWFWHTHTYTNASFAGPSTYLNSSPHPTVTCGSWENLHKSAEY